MIRLLPLLALAGSLTAPAQPPQKLELINGKVETRPLAGPLTAVFHQFEASATTAQWMAYTIPAIPGQGTMCGIDQHNNIVRLEGVDTLLVLFRFENRALDRVRVSSLDCQFDAGGLPFIQITGVPPSQSIDLLTELVHTWTQTSRRQHLDSLVTAIALTRDPAADHALQTMLSPSQPDTLREKVLFWLANSRGAPGFDAVRKVLQTDPSDKVREKATFAVSVSKEPGAMPALVESARKDASPRVRKQALFWLAQKGGVQQSSVILQAAQQDPDLEVRRHAVFALHEIPHGDGIPLLIQLAKTSQDKEVKKQAVFWLSQTKDARATTFFTDILK